MSWYQRCPVTGLEFLMKCRLPQSAAIIDIGGGDSLLANHLLQMGYSDITVLDISGLAIERAKQRLGPGAEQITWIESDILDFQPERSYDYWHDRATFHFLSAPADIQRYASTATSGVSKDGYLLVGTFAAQGPEKCSGLPVTRYTSRGLSEVFQSGFLPVARLKMTHQTPWGSEQEFVFAGFKRK